VSIITDIIESRKLELARSQPNLSFLPFSALGLLVEIHTDLFPDVGHAVQLSFVTKGPLACIAHASEYASIYIHQLLNHSETPVAVIGLILKHELLHLRIPPTIEDGKEVQHPPAFWEAERAIAPERHSAWTWIWENLWSCLKRRPQLEGIDVLSTWKQVWSQPKTDIATCEQMAVRPEQAEDEGGW